MRVLIFLVAVIALLFYLANKALDAYVRNACHSDKWLLKKITRFEGSLFIDAGSKATAKRRWQEVRVVVPSKPCYSVRSDNGLAFNAISENGDTLTVTGSDMEGNDYELEVTGVCGDIITFRPPHSCNVSQWKEFTLHSPTPIEVQVIWRCVSMVK